jgi:uncharacterized protein
MLTLTEVLNDAAALDEFAGIPQVHANTRGASGWTPLHWMASLGDVPGVRLLLEAGAEIDAADEKGNTPLHEAVDSRQHLVVQLLLQRGASDSLRNEFGLTPRQSAKRTGYEPTLEVFENAG